MVASDVHGKNHYKNGSFSNYIEWLEIINNDGQILRCSKYENKIISLDIGGNGFNWNYT